MRLHRALAAFVFPVLLAAACAEHAPPPEKPAAPVATATAVVVVERPAVEATPVPAAPVAPADRGAGAYPGFHVPAFKATVRRPSSSGVTEQPFDSRATAKPTLYVINSSRCPTCVQYAGREKALEAKYMPLGVDVVHVYPNRKEPADEKAAWHAKQGFLGGQIVDADASIARSLEVERTPTVYLVSATGVIVYRGGIDGNAFEKPGEPFEPWAADAIEAHLAGRPIADDTTEPSG